MLNISNLSRTRSVASLPCKIVWEIWYDLLPRIHFITRGFSPWTASGFYPWGNVVSPRKRVAEGLCGGRHGNSFPMTQSAQSHRQMRSIPHCSKAVFLCFCFFIPFTIRQQCIIYPHKFSTDPIPAYTHQIPNGISLHLFRDNLYIISTKNGVAIFGRHPINWELWVLIMFGEN